ncbi:hypothetical protein BJ508DRAFT_326007 [Ascobolus immersus RN42]|uniref:Uncharacterized protein n=1 Tax=Ascobolus immersus RN42 TaxID=1160509 RepID=A0A3N4IBF4_ASCIM|nr:hypothetical protein BJ508DRAFT_326007 [Ascobolus immersus RN42]
MSGPKGTEYRLKRTEDLSPVYEHLYRKQAAKPEFKVLKPDKKHRNELVRARYRLIFEDDKYRKAFRRRENSGTTSPTPSEGSDFGQGQDAAATKWSRHLTKLIPHGDILPEKASQWKSLEEYAKEMDDSKETQEEETQETQEDTQDGSQEL